MSLSPTLSRALSLGMTTLLEARVQKATDSRTRLFIQKHSGGVEVKRKIDLSKPYEAGLAAVLSLPAIHPNRNEKKRLAKEFRRLYQAANGRFVSTSLGTIAIAPAVAPWLKDAPLFFATQEQFFRFVAQLSGATSAAATAASRFVPISANHYEKTKHRYHCRR
jgi:hypothetical protein